MVLTAYLHYDELIHALGWQADMGVDCCLHDEPVTDETEAVTLSGAISMSGSMSGSGPAQEGGSTRPTQQAGRHAGQNGGQISGQHGGQISGQHNGQERASLNADMPKIDLEHVKTLDALKARLAAFEGCALKRTASNLVFCDGNPHADIMLIGEAPGREEDKKGLPFVGAAGQLLDKMLASIGLDRQSVYITNILPWRPPGNRTPSVEETEMMYPFLIKHIQLKNPKCIVALGGSAAKLLLQTSVGIVKLRGAWGEIDVSAGQDGTHKIPILPSLHPAYLLRTPQAKAQAFADLVSLRQKYP